jgi:uncharacterized lipoprotein
MSPVRVIAAMLTILGLGACSGETTLRCSNQTEYLEATSTGTLRIPDDLSVPDESDSLNIPGAPPTTQESAEADASCLEESPAFSNPAQP